MIEYTTPTKENGWTSIRSDALDALRAVEQDLKTALDGMPRETMHSPLLGQDIEVPVESAERQRIRQVWSVVIQVRATLEAELDELHVLGNPGPHNAPDLDALMP